MTQLTATSSSTPCQMIRPEGFHSVEKIWYDKRLTAGGDPDFQTITYRDPDPFLEMAMSYTASDSDVSTMTLDGSGFSIQIKDEQAPTYWTILEGYDNIIFDSYDSDLESNLQASKSLARGVQRPTLTLADASVPDLPENLMILLKDKSRSFYFDVYKDGVPTTVARRERQSETRSQRKKYITKQLQQERTGPDYGRRS